MKHSEIATPQSQRGVLLVHFLSHIETLFARLPDLVGFSVLERSSLSAEREAACLDDELAVADVSVHPWPSSGSEATGAEIAAILRELLEEHPSARGLLCGFAFARTFH
jgi:hypothetical protein